jgi:hypothetical protein
MENSVLSSKSVFAPLLINKEDLFKLIDIREPYFALQNIFVDDKKFVTAHIPIQQAIGSEVGPISTAEACRHMAAAGTVSCAYSNPVKKKHYYLAYSGSFKRISNNPDIGKASFLVVNSMCIELDKKHAVVKTQITDTKHNIICEAEIGYLIVPENAFGRLFTNHFVLHPDFSIDNPYKLKNELFDIKLNTTHLTASLGRIPESYCSGQYQKYPALSSAIILYNLLDLAGLFIYHSTRNYRLKFMVKDLTMTSDSIAFAGDKVDLEIKHMQCFDNLFVLSCIATANGNRKITEVNVSIEGVK